MNAHAQQSDLTVEKLKAEIERLNHWVDEAFNHVIDRDVYAARRALTCARWGEPKPKGAS